MQDAAQFLLWLYNGLPRESGINQKTGADHELVGHEAVSQPRRSRGKSNRSNPDRECLSAISD
jgi:hypothetical protein